MEDRRASNVKCCFQLQEYVQTTGPESPALVLLLAHAGFFHALDFNFYIVLKIHACLPCQENVRIKWTSQHWHTAVHENSFFSVSI